MSKTNLETLYKLHRQLKSLEDGIYKGEILTFPSLPQSQPDLFSIWSHGTYERGDGYRIDQMLKLLLEGKKIFENNENSNHLAMVHCSQAISKARDHLSYLILNALCREDLENPSSALLQLTEETELSPQELYSAVEESILTLPPLLLDDCCPIQEEMEDEFPEIFEFLFNHHIPLTDDQGEQLLSGDVDGEDFLLDMQTFFYNEYIDDCLEEGEEDDYDEVLYMSCFEFAPLIEDLKA